MNQLERYLEENKLDELVEQFRAEGYEVVKDYSPANSAVRFDLLARKGDLATIVEVKTSSSLGSSSEQLAQLRHYAAELGIEDFRLYVVRPPHPTTIEIEELELKLVVHLNRFVPPELGALARQTSITEVYDLEYDSLQLTSEAIYVMGTGAVRTQSVFDSAEETEDLTMNGDYPFRFRIELTPTIEIAGAEIQVDTRSFYQ